jgi:hypothetical protein
MKKRSTRVSEYFTLAHRDETSKAKIRKEENNLGTLFGIGYRASLGY